MAVGEGNGGCIFAELTQEEIKVRFKLVAVLLVMSSLSEVLARERLGCCLLSTELWTPFDEG